MTDIRRAGVVGAGTMGSRIAALFADAGISTVLLDVDEATVRRGIDAAGQPLVQPGGFTDLPGCDWIVEAVTENLAVKREILSRIIPKPGAIVSTNTSGISLASITEGFDASFRQNFLGAHFFNPPRQVRLLELIPGVDTLPAVSAFVSGFAESRLGRQVVLCKDTPNFIANRIGAFFSFTAQQLTMEGNYSIEEVDLLTGPLIGFPKSASYRLLDIIGLDVWMRVTANNGETELAPFLMALIQRGWLGDKTRQGCYRKLPSGQILVIDTKTLEYHPFRKPEFASVEAAGKIDNLPERLRFLVMCQDRAGRFVRTILHKTVAYARAKQPLISHAPEDIDSAMRWGYNWTLGPFAIERALHGA